VLQGIKEEEDQGKCVGERRGGAASSSESDKG